MGDDRVPCTSCGSHNPATARFCMSCGASVEISCPSCATPLPASARFCSHCGHELQPGARAGLVGTTTREVTGRIADHLAEAPTGERRTITMLFCDLVDSTATAERLDPEDWAEVARAVLDAMIAPVERYGGTVARLLGDAILAYFGAPIAHEDDPERAVLAALEILDRVATVAVAVRQRHGVEVAVRIGVNTGLVVVGDVGSERYGEYAALGDAANVAARMEQTAEPGTVRVAETTARAVAPLFALDEVGPLAIRGRQQPVTAYRVLAALASPQPTRGIVGLRSPIVGRDHELAQLRAGLEELRAGRGSVVALIGEAGLGKSRLVEELAGDPAGSGVRWIEGRSHSYDAGVPYAPFRKVVADLVGAGEDADTAGRREAVARTVHELLGQREHHELYLGVVLGLPPAPEDEPVARYLEPPVMRERVFASVGSLLAATAVRTPTVLVLEDLHWADPTSLDLVRHLLGVVDRSPVLLVLLFRPGASEPSWAVHETALRELPHRYTAITLEPLGDEDTRRLVANLLRVEGLPDEVRQLILRKADGNPFFVEEVVRVLLDDGVVVRDGDRFVATSEIDDVRVPDSLAAVLAARMDRLELPDRRVLQVASVLGREFRLADLRTLVEDTTTVDDAILVLQRRELLVGAGGTGIVAFKHALTRDAAYDTLLLATRRELHRRVADRLEALEPDRVHDLARHLLAADEPRRALPYLVGAGERSFAAFAIADAVRHLRSALELWQDGDDPALARRAYEALGTAQFASGDVGAAIGTFDAMLSFARAHGDEVGEVSALNKRARARLMGSGDPDGAERDLLAAKALADRIGDEVGVAEFHVGYCVVNVTTGRLDAAEAHLGEAAEVCFTLDPFHRNFGLTHYANTLIYQTRLPEARAAVERAWEQAQADDDRMHLADLLIAKALLDLYAGDPEAGLPKTRTAAEMAAEIGAFGDVAMATWAQATLAHHLGYFEEAATAARRCVEVARRFGPFGFIGSALTIEAAVHQALHGRGTARVRELLAEAKEAVQLPLAGMLHHDIHAAMAFLLLAEGDVEATEECLAAAAQAVGSTTVNLVRPELLLCAAGVALRRGDLATAARLVAEARAYVEDRQLRHFLPKVLYAEASVAAARGDVAAAVAGVHGAEDLSADMHLRSWLLHVREEGARVLSDLSAGAASEALRQRAADTVADLAGRLEDAGLRRAFLRAHALVG